MSHIAITKAFLQTLIGQSSGAQIVNIISIAGLIGTGFRTMYSAAKFGTAGFFKALRAEVRQYGIGITNIYPEFVKTNISKNAVLGAGQTFGKTDTNISTGIEVDDAVDIILRSTFLKYDSCSQVSSPLPILK
jgi:short-subunit dehydrogenase